MFKAVLGIDGLITTPPRLELITIPLASFKRKDLWDSRQAAKDRFLQSKFYQKWNSRAFENFIKYGLRDLPTLKYPNNTSSGEGVTLTCPVPQELATYTNLPKDVLDPNPGPLLNPGPYECLIGLKSTEIPVNLLLSEIGRAVYMLYVEHYSPVEKITLTMLDKKTTHTVPLEDPDLVAKHMTNFFSEQVKRWRKEEEVNRNIPRYTGIHPIHQKFYTKTLEVIKKSKL